MENDNRAIESKFLAQT